MHLHLQYKKNGFLTGLIATNPYQKSFLAWQMSVLPFSKESILILHFVSDMGLNEINLVWVFGILKGVS